MLSLINDDDVMEAFVAKLCNDDLLLQRLRTALFPETATRNNSKEVLDVSTDTSKDSMEEDVHPSLK